MELLSNALMAIYLISSAELPRHVETVLSVPRGKHILVDGRLEAKEWSDARRVASPTATVHVKRDDKYLYVAVERAAGAFSVDLYFDHGGGGEILNLHASAKLGERSGTMGAMPEWTWWNNRQWVANVVKIDTFAPVKFHDERVKEFQIEISRIRRRFRLSADIQSGNVTESIPYTEAAKGGREWLQFCF